MNFQSSDGEDESEATFGWLFVFEVTQCPLSLCLGNSLLT
jgi:hypothetical protein